MRRGGLFFLLLLELGLATLAGVTAAALVDIISVAGGQSDNPSHTLSSSTPAVQAMQRGVFVLTFMGFCGAFILVHVMSLLLKLRRRPANGDTPPRSIRDGLLTLLVAATFAIALASSALQLVVAHGGPLPAAPALLGWLTTLIAFFALCFVWNGHAGWRHRALIASGLVVASSASLTIAQSSLAPTLVTSVAALLHLAFDEVAERLRARQSSSSYQARRAGLR
jgi:hypothetical protein